ncbi:dihydropteroate synthase [Leucobacter luti]|uniref:7,8-dihydroneopterin aldolase n=1 Tax=Leucobacter luti TaxID=340320 RepID=A0A4R6S3R3_9MICO|nr:dihydropteroate synthase [Leucobacter luti]TDP94359.1 dihydropteroate synthase [Leucobacter luti]
MLGGEVRPLLLGVLNVTPDSFSDGGVYHATERAIARGHELVAQGADIVDIGGESTRPGATPVSPAEEQARVLPVITALTAAGIAVSIDTIHATTAAAAVAAGARYINDVSGGLHDPAMMGVAAEASRDHGVTFIVGHWRGIPDRAHQRSDYADVVAEVRDALAQLAAAARAAGVAAEHLVLDPGLGFDKTGTDGWRLLAQLDQLTSLGYPVLVGASRKRMLAEVLAELAPQAGAGSHTGAAPRDLATAVVSALAAGAGAWGVRVHDVSGSAQALAVAGAWAAGAAPAVAAGPAVDHAPAPHNADRITLTGLEVFAHHGVFDFERERGQRFVIDAEVSVDLSSAAAGDALAQTVHYGELASAIVAAVERDPVDLIETVAERIAGVALRFPGVREARITVHKPDAPIEATFADVSVSIVRRPAL